MRLRTDELVTRRLGNELVILDLRSSRYLSVTGVGLDIVRMLGEERSEADLVVALQHKYDAPEDVLRRDTGEFLDQLRDAGLLE